MADDIDMSARCLNCDRTISWHRVYRTKAGVRAFCKDVVRLRADMDREADDIWWRLHTMRTDVGTQLDLF